MTGEEGASQRNAPEHRQHGLSKVRGSSLHEFDTGIVELPLCLVYHCSHDVSEVFNTHTKPRRWNRLWSCELTLDHVQLVK